MVVGPRIPRRNVIREWSGWKCTIYVAIRTSYNSDHLSLSMSPIIHHKQNKKTIIITCTISAFIYWRENKLRVTRESKHVQIDYLIAYAYIIQVDLTFIKQLFVELYHGSCLGFVHLKFLQKRRS